MKRTLNLRSVRKIKNQFSYGKDGSIIIETKRGDTFKIDVDVLIALKRGTNALFEYQYLCEHYGVGEHKELESAAYKITDRINKSPYVDKAIYDIEHDTIDEIENNDELIEVVKAYRKANHLKTPKKAKKGKNEK